MKTLKFMINFRSKIEYLWRILIIIFFYPLLEKDNLIKNNKIVLSCFFFF